MVQLCDKECNYCNEKTRNPVQLQCAHQVCLHCAQEMFLMTSLKQAEVSSDDLASKAKRKFNAAMLASTSSSSHAQQQEEDDKLDLKCTHIAIHCPQCNQQTLIERAVGPEPISSSAAQGNENCTVMTVKCEYCDECDATCYCTDCKCKYCDDCFANGHRGKKFASHEKSPLENDDAPISTTAKIHVCSTHPSKSIEYYCNKCFMLTCGDCSLIGAHKGHDHISLQEYNTTIGIPQAEKFQKERLPLIQQQFVKCKQNLQETLQVVMESSIETKKAVHAKFDALRKAVNNKQNRMIQELYTQGMVCENELVDKLNETNQALVKLQSLGSTNFAASVGNEQQQATAFQLYKINHQFSCFERSTIVKAQQMNQQVNAFAKQLYKNQQDNVNSIDMIEKRQHDSTVAELNQKIAQLIQQNQELESRLTSVKDELALKAKQCNEQQAQIAKIQQQHDQVPNVQYKQQPVVKQVNVKQEIIKAGFKEDGSISFTETEKLHSLDVPCSGKYHFVVCGAHGGTSYGQNKQGGSGAIIECDIILQQGEQLDIVCGYNSEYGGGGGTFISINGTENPLIVAGGGGVGNMEQGHDASLTEDGTSVDDNNGGTQGYAGEGDGAGAGYYGNSKYRKSFVNGGLEGGGDNGGGGFSGGADGGT